MTMTMRALSVALTIALCEGFTAPGVKPFSDRWVREAEKKHARVALLAVPALVTIASATGQDPVQFLNAQPATTQILFYSAAGLLETLNLRRFDKGFDLKPDEVPGKLLPVRSSAVLDGAEDALGRVAMVVAVGFFSATLNA